MKKFTVLFTCMCFAIFSHAQISITSSDIVNAGDSIFMSIDILPNNSGISPGGTGNQTWDFTSLEEQDVDSIFLLHSNETPYYESFPTSNISAFVLPDSIYAYVTLNESGLYQDGMAADINDDGETDTIVSTRSDLMIALPANYMDLVLDTAITEIIIGNLKMNQTIFSKDTIDAYGEISIPSGTYSSLRKFRRNIHLDSLFSNAIGDWTLVSSSIDTTYEYEWWTNDPLVKFFLCSFEYDMDADTIKNYINHIKEVRFSNINSIALMSHNLIFPNPSSGTYTLKSNLQKVDLVEIIDYTGKVIEQFFPETNEFQINISEQAEGVYLFRINAEEKKEVLKVVLRH